MNSFTFNGKSSAEFGLLVDNITVYGAPQRIVEKVSIPYRNGDLLLDSGAYANYIITYDVSLITNTQANMRAIVDWLLNTTGYKRLTDTYNIGEYRMGAYYNQIDWTMQALNRYGQASISFDCKPQRYLTSGETVQTFTADGTINNPTNYYSKPLITVTGNGSFNIEGQNISVSDNDYNITIDSERMQCYYGSTNMNDHVTFVSGDYPVLIDGDSEITLTGVTLDIIPRWWQL